MVRCSQITLGVHLGHGGSRSLKTGGSCEQRAKTEESGTLQGCQLLGTGGYHWYALCYGPLHVLHSSPYIGSYSRTSLNVSHYGPALTSNMY